jgi:predicted membrane channel-forming protein YqfA (hemolysin III family)
MRMIFIGIFGVLMVISILLWIVGFLGVVAASWLPPQETEFIGVIVFVLAGIGELGVYLFGGIRHKLDKARPEVIEKYGLK